MGAQFSPGGDTLTWSAFVQDKHPFFLSILAAGGGSPLPLGNQAMRVEFASTGALVFSEGAATYHPAADGRVERAAVQLHPAGIRRKELPATGPPARRPRLLRHHRRVRLLRDRRPGLERWPLPRVARRPDARSLMRSAATERLLRRFGLFPARSRRRHRLLARRQRHAAIGMLHRRRLRPGVPVPRGSMLAHLWRRRRRLPQRDTPLPGCARQRAPRSVPAGSIAVELRSRTPDRLSDLDPGQLPGPAERATRL